MNSLMWWIVGVELHWDCMLAMSSTGVCVVEYYPMCLLSHRLSLTALRFSLLHPSILHLFMQPIRSHPLCFSSLLLLHSCQNYLTKRGEEASKDSCVAVFSPSLLLIPRVKLQRCRDNNIHSSKVLMLCVSQEGIVNIVYVFLSDISKPPNTQLLNDWLVWFELCCMFSYRDIWLLSDIEGTIFLLYHWAEGSIDLHASSCWCSLTKRKCSYMNMLPIIWINGVIQKWEAELSLYVSTVVLGLWYFPQRQILRPTYLQSY